MKPKTKIILSLLFLFVCVSFVIPSDKGWVVNPDIAFEQPSMKGRFISAIGKQPVQIRFLGIIRSSELSPFLLNRWMKPRSAHGNKRYSRIVNHVAVESGVKECAVFAVENNLGEPVSFYGDENAPSIRYTELTDSGWSVLGLSWGHCHLPENPFVLRPFENLLLCTVLPPASSPWNVLLRSTDEEYYSSEIVMREQ